VNIGVTDQTNVKFVNLTTEANDLSILLDAKRERSELMTPILPKAAGHLTTALKK